MGLIDRVRGNMMQKGIFAGQEIGTQGYLNLVQLINGTATAVNFDVIANTGTVRSTERRLDNTDMFTITHWSLTIVKAANDTAPYTALSGSTRETFPNPLVFSGTGEASNLMNIYNGFLSVQVDRRTLIDSFDANRFYRVAQAQKLVGSATAAIAYQADGWDTQNYGFAELDPEITLNGLGQNTITLQLPNSTNLAGTSSVNYVQLTCRGIRWQNASKVNPK